jgi:hypothetical protein
MIRKSGNRFSLPLNFYLDDDHKLGWGTTESKPTLTEQQAMIVAVATMAVLGLTPVAFGSGPI